MSTYTNWVGKKFNEATAATGKAVASTVSTVEKGVSKVGDEAGKAVSSTTKTASDGLKKYVFCVE